MPSSLQDRLRELRQAREAAKAANPPSTTPAVESPPKLPKVKKERPPLYVEPDRRWRPKSEEEAAMLNDQCDAILERAAKQPFTLSKALASYPQPVLRHLCVREKVPVPHSTTRGQRPRQVFVEALCQWLQQRGMTTEAQEMPVRRRGGKAAAQEPPPEEEPSVDAEEEVQPEPEPESPPTPGPTAEELAEAQAEQYERDCAEIMAGNNSIVLLHRVKQTLRQLVKDGTLTQKDADAELKQLKAARG